MICEAGTAVVVPYPFVEHPVSKVRPALVLSDRAFNAAGNTLTAMITTAARSRWPQDWMLRDWDQAGLKQPCLVRFKVFTLPNEVILRAVGRLSPGDLAGVHEHMRRVFALPD